MHSYIQEYFYVQVVVVADELRHLEGNNSKVQGASGNQWFHVHNFCVLATFLFHFQSWISFVLCQLISCSQSITSVQLEK